MRLVVALLSSLACVLTFPCLASSKYGDETVHEWVYRGANPATPEQSKWPNNISSENSLNFEPKDASSGKHRYVVLREWATVANQNQSILGNRHRVNWSPFIDSQCFDLNVAINCGIRYNLIKTFARHPHGTSDKTLDRRTDALKLQMLKSKLVDPVQHYLSGNPILVSPYLIGNSLSEAT